VDFAMQKTLDRSCDVTTKVDRTESDGQPATTNKCKIQCKKIDHAA